MPTDRVTAASTTVVSTTVVSKAPGSGTPSPTLNKRLPKDPIFVTIRREVLRAS
jgi:hypothetical protein